jgi:outer membrane protein assembly factor BamB
MAARFVLAVALLTLALFAGPASAAAPRAASSTDWPTYHGNGARTGFAPHAKGWDGGLHVVKRITLDGAVYASPIVVGGRTVVATENDTVYAFGPRNGLLWKRHLATPVRQSALPCGNIDPLGITGTPVYSARTKLVYVAAEVRATRPAHRLFALRIGNGSLAWKRSLDLPGVDQVAMQQRGALTLSHRRVWVPFGGLAGDCGQYKGRLIGYSLSGAGSPVRYTVPTAREAGMWTPPGPSVGAVGNLYVAVGNGASGPGDRYDHSDSVLKLDPTARLMSSFSPRSWASDNASDLDLGSQGPALVGTKWVFAAGKSGTAYVLHQTRLGGIGGQVSSARLCTSFGGTAVVGNVVYVPCTDGVRAVRIDASGRMHVLWHASSDITGSPVVAPGVVWALDPYSGVLHGLGPWHGHRKAQLAVGATSRFATPALSGNRVLVGTMSGLTVLAY